MTRVNKLPPRKFDPSIVLCFHRRIEGTNVIRRLPWLMARLPWPHWLALFSMVAKWGDRHDEAE